jgi:hypothetical protein
MDNELNNIEINKYLKNYSRYKGCYQKDNLPMIENRCYYIVNLQSSKDGDGTHWCLLYCIKKNLIFWFDPIGFLPPEEISTKYNYYYNPIDIQDIDATTCGYFCIACILYSYSFIDVKNGIIAFIKLFNKNDTTKNNNILNKILTDMNLHLKVVFE